MKQPEKHKELLLKALEKSLGIVTPACKEVGISRNQFYKYCKEDPIFKAAVDDINEITLDFVENQLLKSIKEGDRASIMFYMKYKARKRGYTDSMDITSDGKSITEIKLIHIKKKDDDYGEKFGD
jgi:hypothetical protein